MTSTKTCSKCSVEKPFSDFNKGKDKYGLHVWCRACYKKWAAEHYKNNKDKVSEAHRRYRLEHLEECRQRQRDYSAREDVKNRARERNAKNREKIREYQREYRAKNINRIRAKQREYYYKNKDKIKKWRDKYRDSHKEQIKEAGKRYRENNRHKINKSHVERLHNDPIYKMKAQARNMVRYAFRSKGHHKESRTKDIVGCNLDFLCDYLLSTWKKNYGRDWDGEPYHIDHIIPLATANTKEDIQRLCHYTNLQLLTPKDNRDKWY